MSDVVIIDTVHNRAGVVVDVTPGVDITVMWKPGQVTFIPAAAVNSGRYQLGGAQ